MALYVKRTDWSKTQDVPTLVNEDVASEVLDYLFNNRNWKLNPDQLVQRIPRWRARLFAVVGAPPVAPDPVESSEPPHWTDVAVSMRRAGKSWNEVSRAVGKPVNTVRDNVRRLEKDAARVAA